MFRRAHYEYLSNKILDDTKLSIAIKKHISDILGSYFEDDFVNFKRERWDKKLVNRFPYWR